MTKKQRYRLDEWQEVFKEAGFCCEVCGRVVHDRQGQSAHMIPATKANIAKYGWYIIHSRFNQQCTCTLECNKKAQLRSDEWESHACYVAAMMGKKGIPLDD